VRKKNRGQSGFDDYIMLNTKETKDHAVFQIAKCGKTVGPTLRGFGVRDFAISNAKHQHTTIPELQKSEWKVGPVLRGFGVRDFANSNAKCQHIATPELRKSERKVGPALRGFGVRDFVNSNANTNIQKLLNCEKVKGRWDQHFGVSGFTNTRRTNKKKQENPKSEMRLGCGPNNFGFRGLLTPDAKTLHNVNAKS
jgi:hypothetical protein